MVHTESGPISLGLRDTLARSGELTGLGPALAPVERDAMLRFLSSAAVLVLRAKGARLDDAEAVARALERYRDRFELLDEDKPFLQEWHVSADQRAQAEPLPLAQLDIHTPGASSSQWCLRSVDSSADPAWVGPKLVTEWFHGKAGNGSGPTSFYRQGLHSNGSTKKIAGAPAGGPKDTSFFLLGPTLRDTLLANIPKQWLRSDDLPVWLDQDVVPSASDLVAGKAPLWRATWTPNRLLLLHEAGLLSGWVSGTTSRPIPALTGTGDIKEDAKAVNVPLDRSTAVPTAKGKALYVSHDLTGTQGLVDWYEKEMDRALADWGHDRLGRRSSCRLAFHTEDGDTYGNRKASRWFDLDLNLLTAAPSDGRSALLAMARGAVTLLRGRPREKGKPGFPAVWRMAHADSSTPATVVEAGARMYASFDPVVLPALAGLGHGEAPDLQAVTEQMVRVAYEVFESLTEPLLTPATIPQVMQARATYRRALDTLRSELIPTTLEVD